MTRILSIVFLLSFSLHTIGQNSCATATFLRDSVVKSTAKPNSDTWYRFRAKGALLKFTGSLLENDSLLEYQIFEDGNCDHISAGYVTPKRSTVRGYAAMTDEIWEKVVNDGRCACNTCISKLNLDLSKGLKVVQGDMYLLKVVSKGKPFEFKLNYDQIDHLNPIQFDIDKVDVSQIENGMVYQMKELFFIPATPKYLKKSYPELNKLKTFLETNKVLKVEVRGHVNGPANTKPKFYQELSDARAKAVKDFLVENGVEADRVSIKGMANKEMRYKSPKNEFEAIENRRVEIVIVSLK